MPQTQRIMNLQAASIEEIAAANGVSIALADAGGTVPRAANENSVCEALYNSGEFAPRCAEHCGRAYERAREAGEAVAFRCHAGLDCLAVPLREPQGRVAIVGRVFTKADKYREATERAISGDWKLFPPTKIFGNVLLTSSTRVLQTVAGRIESALAAEPAPAAEEATAKPAGPNQEHTEAEGERERISKLVEAFQQSSGEPPSDSVSARDADEAAAWRSFFGSLTTLGYRAACASVLEFLASRYALESLAWLESRNGGFEVIRAIGDLAGHRFRIGLDSADKHLATSVESLTPLRLRQRKAGPESRSIAFFPVAVGGIVQNALVVADTGVPLEIERGLARFCAGVAPEIEVLRLREEVERRRLLQFAVDRFNASLRNLDSEEFWSELMRISAGLLGAERGSLLLFDEKNNAMTVKAAVGTAAELLLDRVEHLGERVARVVLEEGRPVVVSDVGKIGLSPAPADWKYKTGSFISYPFIVGDRRIGVLNVADKADGGSYTEYDLELLEAIAPQVAVVIDRAALKERAGEFEQLSVTDPLTGLLNRRYLEERLAEEVKRSSRYGYPMSFVMIDVDDFGRFNKDFGVLTGDRVLRETAVAMRSTLRGADIAARYGGEEFCLLLPQTTPAEARMIAERVRHAVESIGFAERPITVSIGISTFSQDLATPEEIVRAADEAMRAAKQAGKNTVRIWDAANQ